MVREFPGLEMGAGTQSLTWDGLGSDGADLSPGRFFVVVTSEDGRRVGSVVKLR